MEAALVGARLPLQRRTFVHADTRRGNVIGGLEFLFAGVYTDGTVSDGPEAHMEQAFENVFGVLRSGGMGREDLVKLVIYETRPGQVAVYRSVRDKMMAGHLCTNTFLENCGVATPDFLLEIDAEAVGV